MIVISLETRPMRFGELHRALDGITKKVLVDTLHALRRDGMVVRIVSPEDPATYSLTDLGRTLHAPLVALQEWAEQHVTDVLAAQDRFDEAQDNSLVGEGG